MDRDEKFEHLFDDDDEFKTEQGDFHFDDNIKLDEPAEYQFSEDIDTPVLQGDGAAQTTHDQPGLFERLSEMNFKKTAVYLIIGIAILAFVGSNARDWLQGATSTQKPAATTQSDIFTKAEVVKAPPKSQIGLDLKAESQLKQLTQQNALLASRVQTLENQMSQTTNQLAAYQNQAAKAAATADALSKTLASSEQQMMQINNALQTIVSAAKKKAVPTPMPVSGLPQASSYYIQAIIPGRAWLKANNGQIITVADGDLVPGFGKVVLIDPQNGVVQTDAGAKINYAIDQG